MIVIYNESHDEMIYEIPIFVDPIPGFERYGISEQGDVYNFEKERFSKPTLDKGYFRVYLRKDSKQYQKLLHRLLAETYIPNPENLPFVDHVDRDTKNNSLSNLRWVTNQQNGMNASKTKSNTSSKYKGVYWDKQNKKWRSHIMIAGKRIHLGSFNSEEEAARNYNEKAIELFGEFASINIIESDESSMF